MSESRMEGTYDSMISKLVTIEKGLNDFVCFQKKLEIILSHKAGIH